MLIDKFWFNKPSARLDSVALEFAQQVVFPRAWSLISQLVNYTVIMKASIFREQSFFHVWCIVVVRHQLSAVGDLHKEQVKAVAFLLRLTTGYLASGVYSLGSRNAKNVALFMFTK